jgi:hypothetical protein
VVEIMYCEKAEASDDHAENGTQCARSFVTIVAALNEGVIKSDATEIRSGLGNKGQVWEAGLRRMIQILDKSESVQCFEDLAKHQALRTSKKASPPVSSTQELAVRH